MALAQRPAHLTGRGEPLVRAETRPGFGRDWADYRAAALPEGDIALVESHLRTGSPMGNERFIETTERRLGRTLKPKRPGPKTADWPHAG